MEAHLVHYNAKYGNFKTAITQKDGVAVVALFIQASDEVDNLYFSKITDHIPEIKEPGSITAIEPGKSTTINIRSIFN